jgi:hypothetical protein
MENRDRDKMSRNTGSTEAGDVNRSTSQNIGQQKSGSSAEFGQKIGRSEDIENESSRQSGSVGSSGMQSDSGRSSGSSGFDSSSDRSNLGENVESGDRSRKSGSRSGNSDL